MAQFHPTFSRESLQDKVVLIAGGANDIGAEFINICIKHGAYICVGDLESRKGEKLVQACCRLHPTKSSTPRAMFHKTDVTDYQSVLDLFDTAFKTFRRIDHVICAAGIPENGNWFDYGLTFQSVRQAPDHKVLDVNLLGTLYVSRVASVYLRHNRNIIDHAHNTDRSIVLVSSVAGFKDAPGMFLYQASKHGVLGLMRSMRAYISSPTEHNLRVNTVCPNLTDAAVINGVREEWVKANLPLNAPLDVAKVLAGVIGDPLLNGKAMYVEGGRAWEFEDNLTRLESEWLGEQPSQTLAQAKQVIQDGVLRQEKPRRNSKIKCQGLPSGTTPNGSVQKEISPPNGVNGVNGVVVNGVH